MKTNIDPPNEILLSDDIADTQYETNAAEQREDVVTGGLAWRGQPLKPWSIDREGLYFKLRVADGCLPMTQLRTHPEVFLSDAVKILYLCCHEPEEWHHLRTNHLAILRQSEAWAQANIPRNMQTEAIGLAMQILSQATITEAIPEPSSRQEAAAGK
jgi:hypothetical protein